MSYGFMIVAFIVLSSIMACVVGTIIDRMGRLEEEDEDYRWNDHQ